MPVLGFIDQSLLEPSFYSVTFLLGYVHYRLV